MMKAPSSQVESVSALTVSLSGTLETVLANWNLRTVKCCVQVLMDNHPASGHGAARLGRLDLHDQVVKTYGVIPVNCALEPLREDRSRFLRGQGKTPYLGVLPEPGSDLKATPWLMSTI
jgi:hypothetical protein